MDKVPIERGKQLVVVFCLVCSAPAVAVDVREIGWEDLVPPQKSFDDPFAALTEEQRTELGAIFTIRELFKTNPAIVSEEMLEREERLESALVQQGIDMHDLMARAEEIAKRLQAEASSVVEELDGISVRLPGYVLPLEFDGQKVTEFFLVPYVGACIHVPPPPPNQMVYVSSSVGIETNGLYDPVWVEGTISTTGKNSEWTAFDGILDITAGYTMKADEIEPYE